MKNIDYWSMLGYNNNALMMMDIFGGSASNIIKTENPEYTQEMFSENFPVFLFSEDGSVEGSIPVPVFNLFKTMADASLKYDRYKSLWKYVMGLYIAHYLTLFLQTQQGEPSATSALQGATPKGIATSKSVDGLSLSYDFMDIQTDLAGYGTYKLTIYGQQLATLTKPYGKPGTWVNW